uniref:Uncharacterized protein n=1 Tax=Cucumis melo TaxID=3656 RepID=A0A9I9CYV6_CUCME
MDVAMSLNALVRLPLSNSKLHEDGLVRHSLFSARTMHKPEHTYRRAFVVEAKGKKGMQSRLSQRPGPPPLPKIEDDGNPKFVIFIRMANVYLWYPLSLINGGTTAKIMVAAKDNFLGKYIYKDTLARNLAAVIYRVRMKRRYKRRHLNSFVCCGQQQSSDMATSLLKMAI